MLPIDPKYHALRDAGRSPEDVFRQVLADGGDTVAAIRTVRGVFGLDLRQAKEVLVRAEGWASSLAEHEGRIARDIIEAINEEEGQQPPTGESP
jgi:hypothetical protein